MPFITRQARSGDVLKAGARGAGPRDELSDWLIAERRRASDAGVRASQLEVTVTYEGKVLDASRVVLHRSPDRNAPPDDDAPCQAGDRPAVPGEFLG